MHPLNALRRLIGWLQAAQQTSLEQPTTPPTEQPPAGLGSSKPIDADLAGELDFLLSSAYLDGIYLQSNLARVMSDVVAAAASMGLLTTENPDGTYGRVWRPTVDGYLWVREYREEQGERGWP